MTKNLISILLILVMALTLPACGTSAADTAATRANESSTAFIHGDADGDGSLSVLDATSIQRHLARLSTIPQERMKAALVSGEDAVSVIDATLIQKKLAGLISSFPAESVQTTEGVTEPITESSEPVLRIDVNGYTFLADFEDNSSAEALTEKLGEGSITIEMHDYGNFEKVGDLPFTLPRNDTQITTAPGDVILYLGSQLTIYYDVNSWNFTRIAKIRGADSSLKSKLGEGNVTVTLSLEYQ